MTSFSPERPVVLFASIDDWSKWLSHNHVKSTGIWLKIAKKGSGGKSVSHADALDVAISYGWIDGQKLALDESYWLQKFTPRKAKSVWSKRNRTRAEQLIGNGTMQPSGLAAVERAKADGRWQKAYDPQSTASVPEDFQQVLEANPEANKNFLELNSVNRYAFLYRLQSAKKGETRAARIRKFVNMLARNERIYP